MQLLPIVHANNKATLLAMWPRNLNNRNYERLSLVFNLRLRRRNAITKLRNVEEVSSFAFLFAQWRSLPAFRARKGLARGPRAARGQAELAVCQQEEGEEEIGLPCPHHAGRVSAAATTTLKSTPVSTGRGRRGVAGFAPRTRTGDRAPIPTPSLSLSLLRSLALLSLTGSGDGRTNEPAAQGS